LDPTKVLLLVQIVVQIILLGFVGFFIVLERKRKLPTSVLEELKSVVKETQNLSEGFHEQVQNKIEIVSQIMNDLDAKIHEAQKIMKSLEKVSVNTQQTGPYSQEDVARLHKRGFEPLDISQITGIPIGEIQLMIKVKNQDKS
jgi:uncharacterized protein YoxC